MRYNSDKTDRDEVAKKLVELEIKNMKEFIDLIPSIEEVLKIFDGKVINKRMETALRNKVSNQITITKDTYFSLSYYYSNIYVPIKYKYCKTKYACVSKLLLNITTEDNKFIYSAFEKELDERKEFMIREIKFTEDVLENVDELINEYWELKNKINNFNNKAHETMVGDYFHIGYFRES